MPDTRKLRDCGTWLSGGTPSKTTPGYWGGDIPWISAKSLKDFHVSESEDRVTERGAENGTRLVPENTILFVVRGMSLANELRVGLTARPVTFNQDLKAIRPADDVDPLYLAYAMTAIGPRAMQLADATSHGTLRLQTDLVGDLAVPMPPLAEQRRIAAVLATWDRALAALDDRLAALRRRQRGLAQRLLSGEARLPGFDAPWREVEFASVFRVQAARDAQIQKTEYQLEGRHPVVDQSQDFVVARSDHTSTVRDVPAIVFGDHTREVKWIDFEFVIGADGTKLLYAADGVDLLFGYHLLRATPLRSLGYSRHMKLLKTKSFCIPSAIVEQRAIATVLAAGDREIALTEARRAAVARQQRGLMQRLLAPEPLPVPYRNSQAHAIPLRHPLFY